MSAWVGKDDPDLAFRENMYNEIIYQYVRYVNHVLLNIGGIYLNERYDGDSRPSYSVVPREKQRRAFHFLLSQIGDLDWLDAKELQSKWPLPERNLVRTGRQNLRSGDEPVGECHFNGGER